MHTQNSRCFTEWCRNFPNLANTGLLWRLLVLTSMLNIYSAASQSTRRGHELQCPEGSAPSACKSFSELRKARDAKINTALENDSYVCFEPKRDEFYVIDFNFPIALEMAAPKSIPGPYDGAGFLELSDYRSGVFAAKGRSKFIVGSWAKDVNEYVFDSNGIPANDEPPITSATVNAESVTVKQEFKNAADELAYFSIIVQRSTGRFDIAYQYARKDGRRDYEAVQGRCLSFRRPKT